MIEVSEEKYYEALKRFEYTTSVSVTADGSYITAYQKYRTKRGKIREGFAIGKYFDDKYYLSEFAIGQSEKN